ncbi:hypothetical protein KFE25_000283 [Diacronema lutheri]|uniref:Selenoprotein S n=2 Tax=Diacronema lutheri TaxID=2081491 RepID=A0A8J5XIW0_DIALT|nr:hypothetical protein KFE25_000283 [Diacronema lutheri]
MWPPAPLLARASWLAGAAQRAALVPAHAPLASALLAEAPGELGVAASTDATPYVAIYVSLVLLLFGGVGFLVYQDVQLGQRKREAVEARTEMAKKLREQGMEREARILDMERAELEEQIEDARLKPAWERDATPGRARAEALSRAEQPASTMNREDRRQAERARRLQEKREKKAKKPGARPPK